MQKEYLSLGNQEVFNGEYMLAVFKMKAYGGIELEDVASEVAAESSTGSNLKILSATNFAKNLDALVYKIEKEKDLVYIAYPWRIFDRVGNVQNILTFIAGNVLGMSEVAMCKLLDVYFPPQMLVQYDGPSYTLDDMRNYLKVFDRPIFGTIIKPKIGLTSSEYAELCYDFWKGGGDFVKNDEPQADQDFCPFDKMVVDVRQAMDRVEEETGQTKVHSFNVSAADLDTMVKRADYIVSVMKPGSYAFLVDGIMAGWTAVQTIRRRYPNVFLHFHRAGHGAFTRDENPFGFTVPVLTKFARLAGASGIHTGTAGIGKMAGNKEEDITAAVQALRLSAKGNYFDQVWSEIPATDHNIQEKIRDEDMLWNSGAKGIAMARQFEVAHGQMSKEKDFWRSIDKMVPIISGGLNPVLLAPFLDVIGTIDFITTMGGGVHSHPMGTQAGAKSLLLAYDAWKKGIPVEEYAKDKPILLAAVEFYNKAGIQAHRVDTSVAPSNL
jgi:ribulose-bisphosphate carboxylase large chain